MAMNILHRLFCITWKDFKSFLGGERKKNLNDIKEVENRRKYEVERDIKN